MDFLLSLHSLVRWAIVVVAILAIVKLGLGWVRKMEFTGMDRGLVSGYAGLMDLQWLLGLIFLLWNGFTTDTGFPGYRIEHAITLTLAVVAAHLAARWKDAEDTVRFRNSFLVIIVSLLLVFGGVASVGGWN